MKQFSFFPVPKLCETDVASVTLCITMYVFVKKKKNTLPTSIYTTDMIILQFNFVSRPLVGLYSGSFDWVDQNMMYI